MVDASVWIDYFNGKVTPQTTKLDRMLGNEELLVGDLILTEVLQGFTSDKDFKIADGLLSSLISVELASKHVALQAAKNFRYLRRFGVTVRKTIDSIIATRCIESGYALLHSDRDFEPFARHLGLRIA